MQTGKHMGSQSAISQGQPVGAEGHLRARSLNIFNTLGRKDGRPLATLTDGRGWPLDLGFSLGEGRGVNSGSRTPAGVRPTRLPPETPGQFSFSRQTLRKPIFDEEYRP
jgi:hypothetical protein